MDIITLALAKKFATKVAAGFSNVEVDGLNIIFTLNDGSKVTLTVPEPAQGVSVVDMNIDDDGSLICTLSDGTTIDAGGVPFVKPERGVDYLTDAEMEDIINDIIEDSTNAFNQNVNQKTTIFDEHAADKIDEYDEHASELTNRIEYLEDEVNDLSDNQLIAEEEGTEIYVTDAAKARLNDFRFTKESSQIMTTGKSLYGGFTYNINTTGIDFTYNKNGSVTAVGTATATAYSMTSANATPYLKTLEPGTYTISGGTSNANIQVVNSQGSTLANTDGLFSKSFTISEETNIFMRIGVKNGITINETVNIMLEQGSTATDYEPYTGGEASPSSDYPQEVEVVEGYGNEFDYNDFANKVEGFTIEGNNRNFTIVGGNDATYFYPINLTGQQKITGSWSTTKLNGNIAVVYEDDSVDNFITLYTNGSGNGIINFTTDGTKNIKQIRFKTWGNSNNITINDLMITKENQEHPYVPYDNNYVDVTVYSDNIWNEKWELGTINNDTGALENSSTFIRTKNYTKIVPNTKYYRTPSIESTRIFFYDEDKRYISNYTVQKEGGIFTTPVNAYYLLFKQYTTSYNNDISIIRGNKITSYEPYKESIVPIPLNGNFIGGIDDYKDTLIVDKFGKCYLNKKIKKIVFDGSQTIDNINASLANTTKVTFLNVIENGMSSILLLCNRLKRLNIFSSDEEGIYYNSNNGNLFFRINKITIGTTENEINTYLFNNNIIIYYPTSNSQLIDLNYTIDLKTFKGVSNITNDENANMKIRYVQDINSVINEIKNTLSS